jgi:hypothetical protein
LIRGKRCPGPTSHLVPADKWVPALRFALILSLSKDGRDDN